MDPSLNVELWVISYRKSKFRRYRWHVQTFAGQPASQEEVTVKGHAGAQRVNVSSYPNSLDACVATRDV